jgi:pyrimidine operon attenuation protein/uracil phosphoribosyltransferase
VLPGASIPSGLEALLMSGPVQVLDEADVHRALVRIAHEVVERNKGADELVVVGIHTRGVPLARRLAAKLAEIEGRPVPAGALDVAMYRDDIGMRPPQATRDTDLPRAIQLAVLVDRGHRELPLRADYVGKNLPTAPDQAVRVLLTETDGSDGVAIEDAARKAVAS